jgi:hypothetical protein
MLDPKPFLAQLSLETFLGEFYGCIVKPDRPP